MRIDRRRGFKMLRKCSRTITPQYWQVWIGLVLVVIVRSARAAQIAGRCGLPNLVIAQSVRWTEGGRSSSEERTI